jgi:hypothetical protein
MRKKLITLTLLAITANVANGSKIQTNQLIHSDDFNKNWKTIVLSDTRIQQQDKFKNCRMIKTTKAMDNAKESKVLWKGDCLDILDKYLNAKSNKPNKGWTTLVSKEFGGDMLETQKNKFKNCRIIRRKEGQSHDVMWSGSCVELMTMNYKGSKFTKGWTTLSLLHTNVQTHDKLSSYRIVDSEGDDSVGIVWTGSYDEVLDEIETGSRFENKKYATYKRK